MNREEIKSFFAKSWSLDETIIEDSFEINDNNIDDLNSISLFQFFVDTEKEFGIELGDVNSILTFGDYLNRILGK